jgi:hypothetical protein
VSPVGRGVAIFFAVTLVAISALSVLFPLLLRSPIVDAQTFSDRLNGVREDDEPVLRWVQGSSAPDTVEFYGSDFLGGAGGQSLASDLLREMGVEQAEYSLPTDVFDTGIELIAELDDHWLNETNEWRGEFDVKNMSALARQRGFNSFGIEVCPVIDADVQYSTEPDIEYDNCKGWTFETVPASAAGTIVVVEKPTVSFYNSLLAYVMIGSLALTALLAASTLWLRQKSLPTLGSTNLVLSLVGVFLAATAITTTALVFLFGVSSVDAVLLLEEGGWREHASLVMLPGFAAGLPFLVASILIVMVKPRPVTEDRAAAAGGVPYWMVASPQAQQPPPGPGEPQQPQTQPPASSPAASPPNPWDPPA